MGNKKLTILILADGLPAGGTERQIVELLKGLKTCDTIQTAIGVLIKGGKREQEAIEYADIHIPVKQTKSYDITMAYSLISLIKKNKIDLVHTFGCISDLCGVIAGKYVGIPIINGSIRSARPSLNRRDIFSKYCMRFASWVVANSHAGLCAFGQERRLNTSVIHNGVDLARFVDVKLVDTPDPTICMVGNFSRKKDQAQLISVMPALRRQFPLLHLIFVGRGKELNQLQQQVTDSHIQDCVSFITDCNNPESIIKSCNIGILLSPQGEGLSNVIIEYMALGKPVIASSKGGNSELVDHGITGYLVDNSEPEQLMDFITQLLEFPELAERMGAAGKKKITRHFRIDLMVSNYESLYFKLVFGAKKRGNS